MLREMMEMLVAMLYAWSEAGIATDHKSLGTVVRKLFNVALATLKRASITYYDGRSLKTVLRGRTRATKTQLVAAMLWALDDAGFARMRVRRIVYEIIKKLEWRNEVKIEAYLLSRLTPGDLRQVMRHKLTLCTVRRQYYRQKMDRGALGRQHPLSSI